MDQHSWSAIIVLAGALQTLTVGIIRYLLKQIDLRDERILSMVEANAKTNTLNEKIVGLYVEDQQERRRVGL
jgi:hypothetical protein